MCEEIALTFGRRRPSANTRSQVASDMKARQTAKMREIREALIADGFRGLEVQAEALGLPRSTAWTVINGHHKGSGLSVRIINRMLSAPRAGPLVRAKILEYIEEKIAGRYGGSGVRLRKFADRIKIGATAMTSISRRPLKQLSHPIPRFVRTRLEQVP